MLRLDGKAVMLTGAAAGSAATSIEYARAGAIVLVTDLDSVGLDTLAAEVPDLRTTQLDLANPDAIAKVVHEAGPIDILCNCAGIVPHGAILDGKRREWQRAFDINVRSILDVSSRLTAMVAAQIGGVA
jgi:2-keto-3-deoxy-L-fuconate dehydrogenase